MKKKGLIVAIFFAVILIGSTLTVALNYGTKQQNPLKKNTITGTPADNFVDIDRPKFCGTGNAKSNDYVTEYKIPTDCTQPLAVTVDTQGNVWFVQTNTGKVAKFEPNAQDFIEYENSDWPPMGRSMMWGMDHSTDGNIWFTDDAFNSIWKFSPSDKKYEQIGFPTKKNALPQQLKVKENNLIVNDFNEGKISIFDITQTTKDKKYTNIPSPLPGSFVGGFDIDQQGDIWYTNWLFQQGGALVKFDYNKFSNFVSTNTGENVTMLDFSKVFNLPSTINAPNGLVADKNTNIWIADTYSSSFFKFNPSDESFTRYVTSHPVQSTYGNVTGVVKIPITQPYWMQLDNGKLIFNEQAANAIAVFDIEHESLIEYQIPSQNPNWGDCGEQTNCGIAQVFGFKSSGEKIWFTEWVENNLGVVDLTKELPLTLTPSQKEITIQRGQTKQIDLTLDAKTAISTTVLTETTSEFRDIVVSVPKNNVLIDSSHIVPISINVSPSALPGTYKVLASARTNDVTISQFLTVTVTQ